MSLFKDLDMRKLDDNPCVYWYGKGPEGTKCKTCKKLVYKDRGKRYYKCLERTITNGAASDHRVRWNACGKYEEDFGE